MSLWFLLGWLAAANAVEADRLPFGTQIDLERCLDVADPAACEDAAARIGDPAWASLLRGRSNDASDRRLLTLQCVDGKRSACSVLAVELMKSEDAQDRYRGAGFALQACAMEDGLGCALVGADPGEQAWAALLQAPAPKGGLEEGLSRAARACATEKEPGRACFGLAATAWSSELGRAEVIATARAVCARDPGGAACALVHDLDDPDGPYDASWDEDLMLAQRVCVDGGVGHGCAIAAGLARAGRISPWGTLRSLAFEQDRCNAGEPDGCAEVTAALRSPMLDRWSERCDLAATGADDPRTCTLLGIAYAFGVVRAKDEARADQLYAMACERGDPAPCNWEADELWDTDPQQAYTWYARGCDAGDGFGCAVAARMEAGGESGVPVDVAAAHRHATRGHALRSPYGAAMLAEVHYDGLGVPRDIARATGLYGTACAMGELWSCSAYAALELFGADTPLSSADAISLAAWTCSLEDLDGCMYLAAVYEGDGGAVPADPGRQRWALARACELEDAEACETLAALPAGDATPVTGAVPRIVPPGGGGPPPWTDAADVRPAPREPRTTPGGRPRPGGGPRPGDGGGGAFVTLSAGSQRSWTEATQASALRLMLGKPFGALWIGADLDLVSDARWRPKVARSYWRTSGFVNVGVSLGARSFRFELGAGPGLGGYREGPGTTSPVVLSYGAHELLQVRFVADQFTAGVRLEQQQLWWLGSSEIDHVTGVYGMLGVAFD